MEPFRQNYLFASHIYNQSKTNQENIKILKRTKIMESHNQTTKLEGNIKLHNISLCETSIMLKQSSIPDFPGVIARKRTDRLE